MDKWFHLPNIQADKCELIVIYYSGQYNTGMFGDEL